MTSFTWHRGRSGANVGDGTDQLVIVGLQLFAPGEATTVRRFLVDWGIDLLASTKEGAINSSCPITLGLTYTNSDTDSPPEPSEGPRTGTEDYWAWWEGIWATNEYGYSLESGSGGVLTANGRIDRQAPVAMSDSVYTKWWLVWECEDSGEKWNNFIGIGWWNMLTAPTVS